MPKQLHFAPNRQRQGIHLNTTNARLRGLKGQICSSTMSRTHARTFSLTHEAIISHKIMQQPPRSPFSNVSSAALVAASNTSSTPSPVRLEHSRYFLAPISCAASFPSLGVVKCRDFFRISSWARGSSRRSDFSPMRIMGTPGQRSAASSTH